MSNIVLVLGIQIIKKQRRVAKIRERHAKVMGTREEGIGKV